MRLLPALAASSILLVAACASHRGEPITKPVKTNTPQLSRGERAYMAHCDKCHPGGDKGLGVALKNKPLPGAMIKAQVRAGLGAMPSFSKEILPDDQLDDLIAYIKELRKD